MKKESFWIFVGYGLSLAMAMVLILTFLKAYFGDYKIMVNINLYGEAVLEFVLICCCLPFIIYGFVLSLLSYINWRRNMR